MDSEAYMRNCHITALEAERDELTAHIEYTRAVVSNQAEDEGCWFNAETAPEAYLQSKLRELHSVVESVPTQSLATIQADAIEKMLADAGLYFGENDDVWREDMLEYAEQLRQDT